MKSLRLSMERVRLLTDQIKKREVVKKRHLLNMIEIFNLALGIKPQKQADEPDLVATSEFNSLQVSPKLHSETAPLKSLMLAQAEIKTRVSPIKKTVQKIPAPVRELSSSQSVIRSIENVINETSNRSQGSVEAKTSTDLQTATECDEEDKENSNQLPTENYKPVNVANKAQLVTSPPRKSGATIQSKLTFFFKT